MVMGDITRIDTVQQYCDLFEVEALHPLVSVVNCYEVQPIRHSKKLYNIYAVLLKDTDCGTMNYGRSLYDYEKGSMLFIAPGQVFGHEADGSTFTGSGWCLLFHPDLLRGTPLGRHMQDYTFFSYAANEALHLSKQEQQTIIDCLTKIDEETYNQADRHTNLIIASAIELLLNYCIRFYDRQFTTRKKENKGMLGSFEALLNDYFVSDKPAERGTLTVAYCADQLNLSANYFGDLIKKETGVSAQEYILTKIMDRAKELLTDPAKSVGDVAYALGYQYPQYFSKAFKRVVGCSPNEYRTLS
mgnify:CR=1 FL=1